MKWWLVFLIEDKDGEKFGYYLNREVIEKYGKLIETDNKTFEFNLESNGRLQQPMKFEIKNLYRGGYFLYQKSDDWLVKLGDILLKKENNKNQLDNLIERIRLRKVWIQTAVQISQTLFFNLFFDLVWFWEKKTRLLIWK